MHVMFARYMVRKEIIDPNSSHFMTEGTVMFGGHTLMNSLKYEKCGRLNHVVQKEDESGSQHRRF